MRSEAGLEVVGWAYDWPEENGLIKRSFMSKEPQQDQEKWYPVYADQVERERARDA